MICCKSVPGRTFFSGTFCAAIAIHCLHSAIRCKEICMKKDKKEVPVINQPANALKKDMPVKNAMTDSVKNTRSQAPGLNQAKTTRDDLMPSDGDNLTK